MRLCSGECVPCCDFCYYSVHETWVDEHEKHTGEAIKCMLHDDDEHNLNVATCGFCDDFSCSLCMEK